MSAPGGYGHNSGAVVIDAAQEIARLQTRVVTLENELAAAQRDRADALRKRDDLQRKKDSSDRVIASDLPAPHKLVTVRMINATDDQGVGHVKRKLLAQAASVKSLEYISKVVRELKAHGVVRQVEANSPLYQVPSLVDLQQAVEAYAAGREKQSVHPYSTEHPPCSTEHPPYPVEHPPCSVEYGYTRTLQDTPRALQDTPRALQSTPEPVSAKGSPPLGPPPFPHTPFPPPIIPPTPKNLVPTESPEQVDSSVGERKNRSPTHERGARLPEDWQPDDALMAWAADEIPMPIDRVKAETEKFRDHFHASSGANARKRKWGSAWRNWIRTASEGYVRDQQRAARFSGQPAPLAKRAVAWWQKPDHIRQMTPDRWRKGIAEHANGTWPVDKLGPPPGHHSCVVPREIVAEFRLTEKYDERGFKR